MSKNKKKSRFMTILIIALVAVLITTIFIVMLSNLLGGNLSFTTVGLPILAVIIGIVYFFLVLKDKMGL